MSNTNNLMGSSAVEKLRQLTSHTPTCMFGSALDKIPMHLCPMHVQQVDDEGLFWFFSGADSVHNRQLTSDPRTQMIFCNPSKIEYLTVFGETTISSDRSKIDELWSKFVEAWFPDGPSDPNLTLLSVRPTLAHYWDTENGKLVTMARILTAAVTGLAVDDGGEQGDITV